MATYAVGDVQGCYDELQRLLEHIKFDPQCDYLWFVGDLVSRGRQSLEVLRFVKGLKNHAITVLGNHDMHLLAVAYGNTSHYRDDSLDQVLKAPDRDELITWLRHRPLLYHDLAKNFVLVHAGLLPQWDLSSAKIYAQEVEMLLRGDNGGVGCPHISGEAPAAHVNLMENGYAEMGAWGVPTSTLMQNLYGSIPNRWSDDLTGIPRYRCIINGFTRLRYCTTDGTMDLKFKGAPGTQPPGLLPWFDIPERAAADTRIICGHWSTLGFVARNNVWALDTGCLWGGKLTALRVRKRKTPTIKQVSCPRTADPRE